MNKKICLISLLILPAIAGCNSEPQKGDFYIGTAENKVINLTYSELSAKLNVQKDTFFLATHQGDACTCWTGFQYVMQQYGENKNIPFYGFDTDLFGTNNTLGIEAVTSGYVDLYVIIDGEIVKRYTKSAKIDFDIFEKTEAFSATVDQHINSYPINNYAYVSYEHACELIKDNSKEFVLFTVRSGCGDCNYCMPNVVTPWFKENNSNIPVYICDIEKYRGTDSYNSVKESLNLTSTASEEFGYGTGVVPTYQYYKNGVLLDAGVYANDSFEVKDDKYIATSFFDGQRNLKYTNENLKTKFESSDTLSSELAKVGEFVYLPTEKEAVYHDSILKDFLSYYCK